MSEELSQLHNLRMICSEAYLQLLTQYPPNEISVKQVVQQANISRSSFYMYFKNRQQLHIYVQQQMDALFLAHYSKELPLEQEYYIPRLLCQHIIKYRAYYQHALQDVEEIHRLSLLLSDILAAVYNDDDYAIFASFGTIGYLQHWVTTGFQKSPSEVGEKLLKIGFTNWAMKIQRVK